MARILKERVMRAILIFLALALTTSSVFGQNKLQEAQKYKTHAEVRLLSEPNPSSKQIGTIPSGTILEALEKKLLDTCYI